MYLVTTVLGGATPGPTGVLEGTLKVIISKGTELTDDVRPSQAPASAEHPLRILSKDGKQEVAEVTANEEGHFRLSLPPGDYILDLKKHGRMRTIARPFTVVAGKTVRVDITLEGPLNVMSAP